MATLLEVWNLRFQSPTLKNRVVAEIGMIAYYIITTEPSNATNHAARVAWAARAIRDPEQEAERLMWAVVSNGDVQAAGDSVADSVIAYIVDSLCYTFA
jgi:hypothetical protein